MKERPILFSGEMVRAILDGRKTQTRRVMKRSACSCGNPPGVVDHRMENIGANQWVCASLGYTGDFVSCPYGKPGDRLWVKESHWRFKGKWTPKLDRDGADTWPTVNGEFLDYEDDDGQLERLGWKKCRSMHLPRWASRINLEITNVRVERLQDISEEDARAEGVEGLEVYPTFRGIFQRLWNKINGKKHPWASDPWVWVVEFKQVQI